jgi:hypothetical protein
MLRGAGAILLALFAGGANATVKETPAAEFRAIYSLAANGRVVVQNLYGDVEITAWDRDEVLVEATKHSADPHGLDDAQVVVDSSIGLVSIRTQYTGADAEHPASVEYHIHVPRRVNLQQVRLINGGLSINGVAGTVNASSVNGSILAMKLAGEADLSTINGRLEASFDRVSRCHAISLRSVNGPIHLSLPAGAGATVSAQNRSGGIDADFGRPWRASDGHRLEAAVNGGGAPVHLLNVNGGISIHSTWQRRSRPVS